MNVVSILRSTFAWQSDLHWATESEDEQLVRTILMSGIDIYAEDKKGKSALQRAIEIGNKGILIILLENMDLEHRGCNGSTPLHWAVWKRNMDILDILIDLKANIDAQDDEGWTALHFAVLKGEDRIIMRLLVRWIFIKIYG